MTLSRFLPSLPELRGFVSAWITGKGWREAWAKGDAGGFSASNGACPDPVQKSSWVFACLRLICDQLRSVPLEMSTRDKKGKDTAWTDPETAAFWDYPAMGVSETLMSLGAFLELSADHIKLYGQAFWILDDTWLSPRGIKSPILLARPDRMNPIMRGDSLVGWLFTDGASSRSVLLPQQVLRPRNLHPLNEECGLSALEASRIAIDADYAAAVYQRNVAASNGDQGVYIIAKGGAALSPEQREQIIAQLRQKAAESRRGNYRPAFLTADVTVEDPKMKTVDEAFLKGRHASRDEVAVAFGVPPSMLQATTSQSIGRASDRYALLENGVMPLAAKLCEEMAMAERKRSGRIIKFFLNWSQHPVMREAREEAIKAATEMWKTGVPWEVISDFLQLNLPRFPGSDKAWLPVSFQPVEDAERSEREVTPQDDAGDDDTAKLLHDRSKSFAALAELVGKGEPHAPGCPCCSPNDPTTKTEERDPARVKLWQRHMKLRQPSDKLFVSKIGRCIADARKTTLAKLESSSKALEGVRQRGVLDVIFDLSEFTLSMTQSAKAAHTFVLDQALMQFAEEIGADDPWKMEDEKVLNFLSIRENKIRDASRRIWNKIKDEIEAGLRDGESNAQIADRVRAAFNGISKERASTIADTEVGAAYGFARHEAMTGTGIEEKEWLSSGLDTVRDSHRIADGQRVAIDEPFIVPTKDGGSEELMYPGDESGSAENVINCKCVQVAVMKED